MLSKTELFLGKSLLKLHDGITWSKGFLFGGAIGGFTGALLMAHINSDKEKEVKEKEESPE